jgi:antitoxin ParD1/3/4
LSEIKKPPTNYLKNKHLRLNRLRDRLQYLKTYVTQIDTASWGPQNDEMAERISMNTSLTPELAEFVKALVGTGRYQSDSEVVRQGLRLLQEHELGFAELKAKIGKGIKQADKGELVDGKAVFKELKARGVARRRKFG